MPINPNEWYQKAIAPGFRRADEGMGSFYEIFNPEKLSK